LILPFVESIQKELEKLMNAQSKKGMIEEMTFDLEEMNCLRKDKTIKIVRLIDKPVWCFKNDKKEWQSYNLEDTQNLETSFQKLNKSQSISSNKINYVINFETMIQKRSGGMTSVN
jgi:hypothetical protein